MFGFVKAYIEYSNNQYFGKVEVHYSGSKCFDFKFIQSKIINILITKYPFLEVDEIELAIFETLYLIQVNDRFDVIKSNKELFNKLYAGTCNRIKNLLNKKNKCIFIEEAAEIADIDKTGYLDSIIACEDCDCIDAKAEIEFIKKYLSYETFQIFKLQSVRI